MTFKISTPVWWTHHHLSHVEVTPSSRSRRWSQGQYIKIGLNFRQKKWLECTVFCSMDLGEHFLQLVSYRGVAVLANVFNVYSQCLKLMVTQSPHVTKNWAWPVKFDPGQVKTIIDYIRREIFLTFLGDWENFLVWNTVLWVISLKDRHIGWYNPRRFTRLFLLYPPPQGWGQFHFFNSNSNSGIFNSNSNSTTHNKFQFQFQFQRFQFQFRVHSHQGNVRGK